MPTDAQDLTKEELIRRLSSQTKDQLTAGLASHLTKDDLVSILGTKLKKEELADLVESPPETDAGRQQKTQGKGGDPQDQEVDESRDLDWSAELAWGEPPAPSPAPTRFSGAAPFMPGKRVRVDLSGLPMLGVFAGPRTSAAGTIVGVNAREREVRVYLDAGFDGEKEIVVPPERITPDA
jgi:hypothetical protein